MVENIFYRSGTPFDDFQKDFGQKTTGEGATKKIYEGHGERQGGNYGQQNFSGQNSWGQGQAWKQHQVPQRNSGVLQNLDGDQMVSDGFLDFDIVLNNSNCNSHVQHKDLNMNLFGMQMANSQQPTPVTNPGGNSGNFWDMMDGSQGGSNHGGNFAQTNANVNNNYSNPFDAWNEQPEPQPTLDIFGDAEPKGDPFSKNVSQSNQGPAENTGGDPFGNFNKHFDGGNNLGDFLGDPFGNQKENMVPPQNNNPGNIITSNPFAGTNPFDSPARPNDDFLSF